MQSSDFVLVVMYRPPAPAGWLAAAARVCAAANGAQQGGEGAHPQPAAGEAGAGAQPRGEHQGFGGEGVLSCWQRQGQGNSSSRAVVSVQLCRANGTGSE
jgi:hypothetical protein